MRKLPICIAILLSSATLARAQEAAVSRSLERSGFTIALNVGLGDMKAAGESEGGVGLLLRIGGMLTPRLALVGVLGSVSVEEEGSRLTHSVAGVAVQGFVSPRLYLVGGIGSAGVTASRSGSEEESDAGTAVIVGLGYEAYQGRRFAVAVDLTGYSADIEGTRFSSGVLGASFAWY